MPHSFTLRNLPKLCLWAMAVSLALGPLPRAHAGTLQVDEAVKDAADASLNEIINKPVPGPLNIVFLPFPDDLNDVSSVFRAELSSFPSPYTFVVANPSEVDLLAKFVADSIKKKDIMDPATLQKFNLKGAEAILYGTSRTLVDDQTDKGGGATATFTLQLVKISTGEILWSGNPKGEITVDKTGNITSALSEALKDVRNQISDSFAKKVKGPLNVYPLAITNDTLAAMEVISPDVAAAGAPNQVKAFARVKTGFIAKLSADFDSGKLGAQSRDDQLQKQLNQVFGLDNAKTPAAVPSAVLYGRVRQLTTQGDDTATLDISLTLHEFSTGQILWGGDFTKVIKPTPPIPHWWEQLRKALKGFFGSKQNFFIFLGGVGVLGALAYFYFITRRPH